MGPNESKQMEMLLEEGGIADDGATVDPVSGNEVPPGSMAKEVRDDVPAQLSEGEYVVPADVVRFFGVKFFEDLRAEAKGGLSAMEANGRIGGEPVSQTMDNQADGELTPEELSVLQELGMAVGGMVPQATQSTDPYLQQKNMYQQPSPVAMGNTGGYNRGGQVLYAASGVDVSDSNVDPYKAQFTGITGSSFAPGFLVDQTLGRSTTTSSPTSTVLLYSPDGMVRSLVLPQDQEEYDTLIAEGWSTQQTEVTTQTSVGAEDRDRGRDMGDDMSDPGSTSTSSSTSADLSGLRGLAEDAVAKGLVGSTGLAGLGVNALTGGALSDIAKSITDNVFDAIFGVDDDTASPDGDSTPGEGYAPGGIFGDVDDDGVPNFADFNDGYGPNDKSNTGKTGSTKGGNTGSSTKGGGKQGGGNAVGVDGPSGQTGGTSGMSGATQGGAMGDGSRGGGSTSGGGTASAGATGAGAPGVAGSDVGTGPDGTDAVGPMNKGGFVARRSKKKKK